MQAGKRNTFPVNLILLASAWIFGLLAGVFLVNQTSAIFPMCSVVFLRISVVGLITSMAMPLLISYILLRLFRFCYILPLVFIKALTFIVCYYSVTVAFGNAGWLIRGMIFFSDSTVVCILILQWFHAAVGEEYSVSANVILYIIAPIIVGCFDYFVVSPYLAMLLNY